MRNLQELKERLEKVVLENADLLDLAENEGRDFTEDEQKRFDANLTDREKLDKEIAEAEKREEAREAAREYRKAKPQVPEQKKVKQRFSILKAVNDITTKGRLEGLEAELHQEGQRESNSFGLKHSGNLVLPGFMMTTDKERTVLTAGTDATAGYLVDNTLDSNLIPSLRAELLVEKMGATMLTGLQSDLTLPRHTTDVSATWEGETDTAAASNTVYDTIALSPDRLGMYVDLSRQLLLQNRVPSVENNVRNSIAYGIKKAVDSEAITGTNSSNGILQATNLGSVALGANGGAPTYPMLVDLETACAIDNAGFDLSGYITTPGVRGKMKQTAKVSSTDSQMIWDNNMSMLNGYRAEVSTQLPSTGTKGTGTSLHTMIFGSDWRELIVAQWGGVDILVDPYTQATAATVRLHVFSWWDFAVKHGQAFAACVDIDIS